MYCIRNRVDPQKYTILEYRLSVFRSQIQGCITAVILFPTLGDGDSDVSDDEVSGNAKVQNKTQDYIEVEVGNSFN